jgi:hypothetical protein
MKQKRKFLLVLPAIAWPFLMLIFHALGGGGGVAKPAGGKTMGLNPELPKAYVDPRRAFLNKLGAYEQAERDSIRKQQYLRQDPYVKDTALATRLPVRRTVTAMSRQLPDERADKLLNQLDQLKQSLHQPQPTPHRFSPLPLAPGAAIRDTPVADPQLDRINEMLDKVIRIQSPGEKKTVKPEPPGRPTDDVAGADPTVNTIAAVVVDNETLTAGSTIALRIIDSIRVNGRILPSGQMVYGVVSINNDRMLIHIGSLRDDRNLYTTDLQAYDLDGLPGIHIPGALGRDVAKESADQGVNALNVTTIDPSLGAEAANAGIQAAKTFFGRKVRQVRVSVRAGYAVLLRNMHQKAVTALKLAVPEGPRIDSNRQAPEFEAGVPALSHCREEGMELTLRAVRIKDSCIWFGLEWRNRSPIVYIPSYVRWTIRDKRVFRRTAVQEVGMEPLDMTIPKGIGGDSVYHSWTAFSSFALPKGKQLVLETGEKGGGRTLVLVIEPRQILKAQTYAKAGQQ